MFVFVIYSFVLFKYGFRKEFRIFKYFISNEFGVLEEGEKFLIDSWK